jgi:hypothetical protein
MSLCECVLRCGLVRAGWWPSYPSISRPPTARVAAAAAAARRRAKGARTTSPCSSPRYYRPRGHPAYVTQPEHDRVRPPVPLAGARLFAQADRQWPRHLRQGVPRELPPAPRRTLSPSASLSLSLSLCAWAGRMGACAEARVYVRLGVHRHICMPRPPLHARPLCLSGRPGPRQGPQRHTGVDYPVLSRPSMLHPQATSH